jgi:anti-sigma-K factor RskA
MSDATGIEPSGDEPEILAAEYVLGTLQSGQAAEAERRIAAEPAFAGLVTAWERRLQPLTALVAELPPPAGLWPRIEDSTAGAPAARGVPPGAPAANDNNVGLWRITALASMAIAAGLAAFIVLRPPPRPIIAQAVISRPVIAVLSPTTNAVPVLIAVSDTQGALQLRPSGSLAVAAGRDLQLWSLPAGASKPASLGVLPPSGKQIAGDLAVGTQLLVSLEPKGGSPTGQPTGPVVYAGKVADVQ